MFVVVGNISGKRRLYYPEEPVMILAQSPQLTRDRVAGVKRSLMAALA